MGIVYKNMSLFEAPHGSILVHAGNSQGVWGSGIAAQMRERYPKQYSHYSRLAHGNIGKCVMDEITGKLKEEHIIATLITASLESANLSDSPDTIIVNTTTALDDFLNYYKDTNSFLPIYSNTFNSGLFRTPWYRTEFVLHTLCERYGIEWTVCLYNPENTNNKQITLDELVA